MGDLYNNSSGASSIGTAGLGAAGLGFVGNLLSGFLGNSATADANATRLQLQREQNAFNERMWNMNNAYNTPSAQMSRYRDAGINPFMAMTNMDAGNSQSSVQSAPAPSVEPVNSFSDRMASIVNPITNTLLAFGQLKQQQETSTGLALDNAFKQATLQDKIRQMVAHTGSMEALKEIDEMNRNLFKETYTNMRSLSNISVDQANENLNNTRIQGQLMTTQRDIQQYYKGKIQPHELTKILEEVKLLRAQRHLTIEQAATEAFKRVNLVADSSYKYSLKRGQDIENAKDRLIFPMFYDYFAADLDLKEQQARDAKYTNDVKYNTPPWLQNIFNKVEDVTGVVLPAASMLIGGVGMRSMARSAAAKNAIASKAHNLNVLKFKHQIGVDSYY